MSDEEMNVVEEEDMETDEEASDEESEDDLNESDTYLPGDPLKEGEELVCDESVYVMLHQAQTGAPCLSFDIIQDKLGDKRETFPLTAYIVAGTQSDQAHTNNIIVAKFSNLHKTTKQEDDDDDDDEESDEEDGDQDPKMSGAFIKHQGCVNRIRSTVVNDRALAASWSELGRVNIWDLSEQLEAIGDDQLLANYRKENRSQSTKPLFTFNGHQKEGFGIDWCRTEPGVLATGDCYRDIHIWQPSEGGEWKVDQKALIGHTASVEDLQWSPNERNVLASCSVDKTIRIWDTRAAPNKACMLTAENVHEQDINVISWNRNEPFLISGGDDGLLKIWDLRRFAEGTPVAIFKHHSDAVTSVEWHPTDGPVFASAGADHQIAQWDLSVERDDDGTSNNLKGIPPQLLFIHQGQSDVKELHWHPQIPGVIISTANSGFNLFRTISV